MRDVTLYEDERGDLFMASESGPRDKPVPAVVGITVAEVEGRVAVCECEWEGGEGCERLLKAERERDEARAERDNVSVEAHHWMGQAARCREALADGKLTAYMVAPKGFSDEKREAWDFAVYEAEQFIARALREALGGGDD